jgi:hypothetical protein
MKKPYIAFAVAMLFFIIHVKAQKGSNQAVIQNISTESYSYKIIPTAENTWGYDIYKGAKTIIHQTSKPGLPGNEGFSTKDKAEKVAGLVIQKLEKGIMPPSISYEELKQLNVL